MKRITALALLLVLLLGAAGTMVAQSPSTSPPPKVLVLVREFMKPGKAGSAHLRTESMFVNAFAAAKWPQRYLAMDSITGLPRSLFLIGYDSFASWEKDNMATQKNATLAAALDRASLADGDMLSSTETSVFVYREDQSYQASVDIAHMRYFEISVFRVKPGHDADWDAIIKVYKEQYAKVNPDAHWAIYESAYGNDNGGEMIVITPMKSLSEVDDGFAKGRKFMEAMGTEGMKKLYDIIASGMGPMMTNLFQFNPKLSYPPDAWVKADPGFWKAGPPPAKKTEAKPAQ